MFKRGDIVKYKKDGYFTELQFGEYDYFRCTKFQIMIEERGEYINAYLLHDNYKINGNFGFITLLKNDIELDKIYYRRKKIEKLKNV